MKKIFISLIATIAFGVSAMAEQDNRVVTCQHGSTIRAYYGADAFKSAHADAADGDIITLTEGTFNGCNVTKALTIRGEGIGKTIISSIDNYKIPQGSEHTLYLEGLTVNGGSGSFNGNDGSEKIVILKSEIKGSYYSFNKCNVTVMQSILNDNSDHDIQAGEYSNVTALNCIIYDNLISSYSASYTPERNGHWYVTNCAIYGNVKGMRCSTIKNSIIRGTYGDHSLDELTNTSSHCLVKEGSSGFFNSYYIKAESDPWDENDLAWDNIFGSNWWTLTDAAAATYLGTDGTQVGVYGGAYPWDTTPDLPVVKWLDVTESYKNGKLNVQINIE